MIRFIDLRGQDTGYRFAFWDTVKDQFMTVNNDQAWDHPYDVLTSDEGLMDRLDKLCPSWSYVDE